MTSQRLANNVALVTGAGRGQGRCHALRLAAEGAAIIALDRCADMDSIDYALATPEDLAVTERLVTAAGGRIVTSVADIRKPSEIQAAVEQGIEAFGHLDIVVANAGVCAIKRWNEVTPELWRDIIDVNLTGTWNTCTAAAPHLIEAGGGSMILVSSTAGLKGQPFLAPYAASKHGMVGIMRVLANELASHSIRVNTIHPTGVDTPMSANLSGLHQRIESQPELGPIFMNALPVGMIQPDDVADTVLYLASDDSTYVTGMTLTIDAGAMLR